jgi:hypothetical protein
MADGSGERDYRKKALVGLRPDPEHRGCDIFTRRVRDITPVLTLKTYGAFVPSGADRAHWEQEVTKAEERRGRARQAIQ